MNTQDIDLEALQTEIMGIPNNMILPEDQIDEDRENRVKTIQKIVSLYGTSRKRNCVHPTTYDALKDQNPFVRVAAADIISQVGTQNSFDYLFKALEDEEIGSIKQKIAKSIDNLEAKINNNLPKVEEDVSLTSIVRILSYTR